jgi:hypothetical protein
VTQTRWVTVCYLRHYTSPALRMISCPLTEPGLVGEANPNLVEQGNRPGSVKICTRAAIGLAYNGIDLNPLGVNLINVSFRTCDNCGHSLPHTSLGLQGQLTEFHESLSTT